MDLRSFTIRVAQTADTDGTAINVAEVSRVLGVARRAARGLGFLSRLALSIRFFYGPIKEKTK